jgi:hypothetical protein
VGGAIGGVLGGIIVLFLVRIIFVCLIV